MSSFHLRGDWGSERTNDLELTFGSKVCTALPQFTALKSVFEKVFSVQVFDEVADFSSKGRACGLTPDRTESLFFFFAS